MIAANIGRSCKQESGAFQPHIDRNRCEGKGDCVVVCPSDVFSIDVLPAEQRKALTLRGKLKGWVHGWQQAFTPNVDACRACGLCLRFCPEKAITLVRVDSGHGSSHDSSPNER